MRAKLTKQQPPEQTALLCEFSQQPFDDCYCRNVNGRTVPNVVEFCMDNYRKCSIYRHHKQQKSGVGEKNEIIGALSKTIFVRDGSGCVTIKKEFVL